MEICHRIWGHRYCKDAAASQEGWKSTVIGAKGIVLTAYLLRHPEKAKMMQEKFKELKAKERK
jgi:hypothetical protein